MMHHVSKRWWSFAIFFLGIFKSKLIKSLFPYILVTRPEIKYLYAFDNMALLCTGLTSRAPERPHSCLCLSRVSQRPSVLSHQSSRYFIVVKRNVAAAFCVSSSSSSSEGRKKAKANLREAQTRMFSFHIGTTRMTKSFLLKTLSQVFFSMQTFKIEKKQNKHF